MLGRAARVEFERLPITTNRIASSLAAIDRERGSPRDAANAGVGVKGVSQAVCECLGSYAISSGNACDAHRGNNLPDLMTSRSYPDQPGDEMESCPLRRIPRRSYRCRR